MPSNTTLSDAIDEYEIARKARKLSVNTLRADRSALKSLLASVGNIYVRTIEPRHIDTFFAAHPDYQESTVNLVLTRIRGFFSWCLRRGYIKQDPTMEMSHLKEPTSDRLFVPVDRFDEMLDAAAHPRDRVILAAGMYLFLRASEIQTLRVGDVDLDAGEIKISIHKTKDHDTMPICAELDEELRRWLGWYAQHTEGALKPEMYLVPAKAGHRSSPGEFGLFRTSYPEESELCGVKPDRMASRLHHVVQRVVGSLGYPTHREGCHTLRRSGARALFDELREKQGTDGALQAVKVMLHHKNVATTEIYLGISPERIQRDSRLRGRPMFTRRALGANVVEMRTADGGAAGHGL